MTGLGQAARGAAAGGGRTVPRPGAFVRLATFVGAASLLAACTGPAPAGPGSRPLVSCLPALTGAPLGAALGSLCEGYRDGTLAGDTYRTALLDYPVLVAGLTALDGLDATAVRGDIEATLASTESLRQACRAGAAGAEPLPACALVAPRWRRP